MDHPDPILIPPEATTETRQEQLMQQLQMHIEELQELATFLCQMMEICPTPLQEPLGGCGQGVHTGSSWNGCYYSCGEPGHFARDCLRYPRAWQGRPPLMLDKGVIHTDWSAQG